MQIGILREPDYETRVSANIDAVQWYIKKGFEILIETNSGVKSFITDNDYINAGAQIKSRTDVLQQSDIIICIHYSEDLLGVGNKTIIGSFFPLNNPDIAKKISNTNNIVFSLDLLPRTTRAQSMDILSSQANIAGYKAVIAAAHAAPYYFPMFMTAAGSIAPSKVLILGAGVAGLQAIATAKRLGAIVEVFDTRPAVKEEVQSLGAKFIEVEGAADASSAGGYAVEQTEDYKKRQSEKIKESVAKSNIIITTAQLQGKKAPILITEEMFDVMKPGTVIVDLASSTGGNTVFTKNNETVTYKNALIIGNSNLQATMPADASKLYAKNCTNFLQLFLNKENKFEINWNDELIVGSCICKDGKIVNSKLL